MNTKQVTAALLFSSLVLGLAAVACGKDDPPRASQKGEACQTTPDCNAGLSCVPRASGGGVCVTGEFKVTATAKECAVVECAAPVDCCPRLPSGYSCPELEATCAANELSSACSRYKLYCQCDGAGFACESGTCKTQCATEDDCGGRACVDGKCATCSTSDECGVAAECVSGSCQTACTSDTQCPSFNRCSEGTCVASGCQSARECVAATGNVEAVCRDAKCVVPCQTDLECGNPSDYRFYSCIQNECVYTGCESAKECQFYLAGSASTPTSRTGEVVCRDKLTTP